MITIIDYNAGNIKSIQNMLKRMGIKSVISNQVEDINNAEKLILPGVGSFDYGMNSLKSSGLIEILNQKVITDKTPILGICLGAQMFGNKSEEGREKGLGWVNMDIVKFDKNQLPNNYKIPHMGWNEVQPTKQHFLFKDMHPDPRFYFVHSYHILPLDTSLSLTQSQYGYEFVSAIASNNIVGVQFHPEKSHKFGMKLLENFYNQSDT